MEAKNRLALRLGPEATTEVTILKLSLFTLTLTLSAQAYALSPLAFVYDGPGSCPGSSKVTSCAMAAAAIAKAAGFEVQTIGPDGITAARARRPAIWIQPGGEAKVQQRTMTDELKNWIVDFVKSGGGYVGFCAGGFLATERFGWMTDKGPFEAKGLGLLPGKSEYYDSFDSELTDFLHAKIVKTTWSNQPRFVYWELGPFFNEATSSKAEVLAYYPALAGDTEKKAMALRSQFGQGRVAVSAFHPEAPSDWSAYYGINDPDGVDFSIATEMMLWAAHSPTP